MGKNLTSLDAEKVIEILNGYLEFLKFKWNQQNKNNNSFWGFGSDYFEKAASFLTNALDETIRLVENLIPGGENKKLAVMTTMEKILDYIIIQTFPVWAKPFSNIIKNFVLNVLISNMIDFIVYKYNSGNWKDQSNKEPEKDVKPIPENPEIFVPPFENNNLLQEANYGKKSK